MKEEIQEKLLEDKKDGINYFDYKRLKEDIWGLINQVEQPEILSQEWIDDHKVSRISNLRKMTMSDVVPVERLEGLLMPSAVDQPNYNDVFDRGYKDGYKTAKNQMPEQPALPVIPEFVAEYIEWQKSINKFSFTGILGDVERERPKIGDWLYDNQEGFFRAWFDGYTVEEKKYVVKDANGKTLLYKVNEGQIRGERVVSSLAIGERATNLLTEKEIEYFDPDYMVFAEEVTE